MKTKLAAAVAAATLALLASACNTVEGAGKDIESASKEIDKEL